MSRALVPLASLFAWSAAARIVGSLDDPRLWVIGLLLVAINVEHLRVRRRLDSLRE